MNTLNHEQISLRKYSKIFTGTNQQNGYENIFLGYDTDYKEIELKKDKSTYFHYPINANSINIHETGLSFAGAFPGSIPAKSDRIYKKMADYERYTPWGNALPEENQTGVWLCSWLSGNITDPLPSQSIWVDRWYNPGKIDESSALYIFEDDAVIDIPSQLTFDPGVLYRYDHIGDETNFSIVNSITGVLLHMDADDMISDDEKRCMTLAYNDKINPSDNITYNIWVHSDDWHNQPSCHIMDNSFRGGWSVGVNNGFFTPMNILLDDEGNLTFNNQNNYLCKNMKLPGESNPVGVGIDSELYTWVADNGIYNNQKHIYKINYNGNIEDTVINFGTNIELKNLLVVDELIYTTNGLKISAYDTMGKFISSTNSKGDKLVYYNDRVVSVNASDVCVYGGFICTIENGEAYYSHPYNGKRLFMEDSKCTNIQRTDKNVWILYDENKLAKFEHITDDFHETSSMTMTSSAVIDDIITPTNKKKNLFFTNEHREGINSNFIWILDPGAGYIYKYSEDLKLIKKINLVYIENAIKGNAILGDASGYQWHLNFNYSRLEEPGVSQIESVLYTEKGGKIEKYKNTVPISFLDKSGWNMITYSINKNKAKLYLNAILRSEKDISSGYNFYYPFKSPIKLGCNSGGVDPLGFELKGIEQLYYEGTFGEIRIYEENLNNADIIHIYLSEFSFNDMVWDFRANRQDYIEEIRRVFKFKMPGQKSQFYNIRLKGLNIQNRELRSMIEDIIRKNITKISPLYTTLYKITWG